MMAPTERVLHETIQVAPLDISDDVKRQKVSPKNVIISKNLSDF